MPYYCSNHRVHPVHAQRIAPERENAEHRIAYESIANGVGGRFRQSAALGAQIIQARMCADGAPKVCMCSRAEVVAAEAQALESRALCEVGHDGVDCFRAELVLLEYEGDEVRCRARQEAKKNLRAGRCEDVACVLAGSHRTKTPGFGIQSRLETKMLKIAQN